MWSDLERPPLRESALRRALVRPAGPYTALDVVESVVMAIAGDEQTLGANARRWLDDDEFIVRRRIHRDFQAARAQG